MSRFSSAREAKEFLVAQIVAQAERDGTQLSDLERKMLYFSETYWSLPGILEIAEEFDSKYDQLEYEKKVSHIIRDALKHARKEGPDTINAWIEAMGVLRKEDHYLLIMADAAAD